MRNEKISHLSSRSRLSSRRVATRPVLHQFVATTLTPTLEAMNITAKVRIPLNISAVCPEP